MDNLKTSSDTLFLLLGAGMVLAMHAGFAFLELGTVRKKNQVNALVKILVDFSVSTIAYELGFASLGPFNRAFRAATSVTPTAWRQEATPALPRLRLVETGEDASKADKRA